MARPRCIRLMWHTLKRYRKRKIMEYEQELIDSYTSFRNAAELCDRTLGHTKESIAVERQRAEYAEEQLKGALAELDLLRKKTAPCTTLTPPHFPKP